MGVSWGHGGWRARRPRVPAEVASHRGTQRSRERRLSNNSAQTHREGTAVEIDAARGLAHRHRAAAGRAVLLKRALREAGVGSQVHRAAGAVGCARGVDGRQQRGRAGWIRGGSGSVTRAAAAGRQAALPRRAPGTARSKHERSKLARRVAAGEGGREEADGSAAKHTNNNAKQCKHLCCSPAELLRKSEAENRPMAPSWRATAPAPFRAELSTNSQFLNST